MSKTACLSLFAIVTASAAGAQQSPPPAPEALAGALSSATAEPRCDTRDTAEVVVCGHSQQKYRIDPGVLAATRTAEAPPKPELDATAATPCTGANCGGGNYVPLVGMALTALKAAELAANGDDWRDAFRTKPDQYRVYQQEKARAASKPRVSIGVSAGTSR